MNENETKLKLLLARAQAKLLEIECHADVGSWEFDLDTKKINWSLQMFKIFDRSPEIGHPRIEDIHQSIHIADRLQWEMLVNKVSIDGESMTITIRLLDSIDDIRWIKMSAMGVFEESQLVAIKGYCQNITELKRLESHYELTRDLMESFNN